MHESWIVGSYIVDPFDHDIYVEWRYNYVQSISLRKKCSYWELFWSAFFRIRTEYGEIRSIREIFGKNADQNNSEYGHFLRSV